MPATKQTRRTSDQMIADLEAQIAKVKARAAARAVKASPSSSAALKAVKALDKAIEVADAADLRTLLVTAREPLAEHLAAQGLRLSKAARATRGPRARAKSA